eukprot:11549988-Ditylum_brightwellii.AAC.1
MFKSTRIIGLSLKHRQKLLLIARPPCVSPTAIPLVSNMEGRDDPSTLFSDSHFIAWSKEIKLPLRGNSRPNCKTTTSTSEAEKYPKLDSFDDVALLWYVEVNIKDKTRNQWKK